MEVIEVDLNLKFLRLKRKERKLRLIDVAKYLELRTANAYWRIEKGLTSLSAVRLMRLCSLFNVKPEELLCSK